MQRFLAFIGILALAGGVFWALEAVADRSVVYSTTQTRLWPDICLHRSSTNRFYCESKCDRRTADGGEAMLYDVRASEKATEQACIDALKAACRP